MDEDKQLIAHRFCEALQFTRAGSDLQEIKIVDNERYAEVIFKNGNIMRVYINMDSGIAMMNDILQKLK